MRKNKGDKKVTLEMIWNKLNQIEADNEKYFEAVQTDITNVQQGVSKIEEKINTLGSDLKAFRTETNSTEMGFSTKSGRHDVFKFRLVGLLQAKNILSPEQVGELRAL